MRWKLKEMSPYLSVAAAAYYLLPLLGKDTGTFMLILLIAVPTICFLTAFIYGIRHGFCLYYGFFSGGLFIPSIFIYYNSTAWPYVVIYGLIALVGNILGKGFHKHHKTSSSVGIIGTYSTSSVISSYVYRDDSKSNEYYKWLNEIAEKAVPNRKTIEQAEEYLVEKYRAQKAEITDREITMHKATLISNYYPHLLETKDFKFDIEKATKRKLKHYAEIMNKRRTEAENYPAEKLSLDFRIYEVPLSDIDKIRFVIETNTEYISSNGSFSDCSADLSKLHHDITNDIIRFMGVTEDDIDNKTPRFMAYAESFRDFDYNRGE